jgi:uncharacterized protein YbjT (DUF2867 family)
VVELAGPQDPTPTDVARALSGVLGRPVTVAAHPPAAAEPTFASFGLPKPWARLYAEMYAGIADGRVAWEGAGPTHRGRVGLEEGLRRLTGR